MIIAGDDHCIESSFFSISSIAITSDKFLTVPRMSFWSPPDLATLPRSVPIPQG